MKKLLLSFILFFSILNSWADPQNGYTELADGTIIEWGNFTSVSNGDIFYYPKSFPHEILASSINAFNHQTGFGNTFIYTPTNVYGFFNTSPSGLADGSYILIGY